MGSCLLPPAPTQLTQTFLTLLCELLKYSFLYRKKMCYESHYIKSNKWFIAIWPETEVEKVRVGEALLQQPVLFNILRLFEPGLYLRWQTALSSGCGADFQESCGTAFLNWECSETRRSFKTQAHAQQHGEFRRSHLHTLLLAVPVIYEPQMKDLPHPVSSSDALMFDASSEEGTQIFQS